VRAVASALLAVFLLSSVPAVVSGQSADPSDAVFQLVIYDHEPGADGSFRGHMYGTAFFVAADGTAITNSHLASIVAQHPQKYRLLAVVGKEFYDVRVVCASRLSYDPEQALRDHVATPYQRDVAEIQITPSTAFEGRKDTLYRLLNKEMYPWATAHTDALPEFPHLTVSTRMSNRVTIIGFGGISAIPYKWRTDGTVERSWTVDGTPIFEILSTNPPEPGNSGSPVLNDRNEAVGLWTWYSLHGDKTRSRAQGAEVLQHPCR
jgi:V8-like Glu-specific endopeptidase